MYYAFPVLCHAQRLLIGHWNYKAREERIFFRGDTRIKASKVFHASIYRFNSIWFASMFEKHKDKGHGDFLEGEFGRERRVEGGRTRAKDASQFPSSHLFFAFPSLLFILPHPSQCSCYPTPSCSLPSFLSAANLRHLLFVWRGLTQWTILSVFPKISQWERDRRVSQGDWSSEVHSPWL